MKLIDFSAYVFLPLLLFVSSVIFVDAEIFPLFGQLSFLLVCLILFSKPIGVIFRWKFLNRFIARRRQAGVSAFWLFAFHAGGIIYSYGLGPGSFSSAPLLFGLVAGIGMIILGMTSNDYSMRLLKGKWKKVQNIAVPTFFLILLHVSLIEGEALKGIVIGGLYIVLKIIERKKAR